jgi:curli biogenesis system outer membrane secretion channel CsgG
MKMKRHSLALLVAALISAPVAAQKEPSEVTDAEIAKYKTSSEAECRAGAAGKGDPKDVEAFCGCIFASLNGSMTRAEWQQAYFYSTKSEPARVREVLGPHLQKSECRPQAAAAPKPAPTDAQTAPKPKAPSQGLRPPSK